MVVKAERKKHTVNVQEVHTVNVQEVHIMEVLVPMRDLGGSPN